MKSALIITVFLCLLCTCYSVLRSATLTVYCPVTIGVNAGLEPSFNVTGGISPGANYVQDNVTCYLDLNFTMPVGYIYTICPQLIGILRSMCWNTIHFIDGTGRLYSTGLFIDNEPSTTTNRFDIYLGTDDYKLASGVMYPSEDRKNATFSVFTLIYVLDQKMF